MTEKESLQNAASEARKAARAGREFAALLDDYAKYLTQPSWRQRAEECYRSALNKLNVITEGLANSHKLIEDGAKAAADSLEEEALKQSALQQQSESEASVKQDTSGKPPRRAIRIAKKAVGK